MTNQEYEEIKEHRFRQRTAMASGKAKEYAKENDRLANFKEASATLGQHPLTVASVYFYKHVAAILTYCRKVANGETPELSEPIEGRLQDAQEYIDIIGALAKEGEKDEQ